MSWIKISRRGVKEIRKLPHTNQLYLKQRLFGLKMYEGSDLHQHINIFVKFLQTLGDYHYIQERNY
ncbi:hypothetical protein CR513_52615, partial [Mucuna pruriens]